MTLAALNPTATPFITEQTIHFAIPSSPHVIERVSTYIASMFENCDCAEKIRSLGLVLEEALSNSIYHGNMAGSSMTMEISRNRHDTADYKPQDTTQAAGKVHLTLNYRPGSLTIVIRDEGKGFDWRNMVSGQSPDSDVKFDSGLKIIRAFSSNVGFNDSGNEITIRMDGLRLRHTTCPFIMGVHENGADHDAKNIFSGGACMKQHC